MLNGRGRLLSCVAVFIASITFFSVWGLTGSDEEDPGGNGGNTEEGEDPGGNGGNTEEGEDPAAEGEDTDEPVTSRETNPWELAGGVAEVSLHRVDDDHMVAQMTVTNEDGNDLHLGSHLAEGFGESQDYSWDYFSGIAWLDSDARQLHRPYYQDDEACLCSSSEDSYLSSAGDVWEGYAVLDAPPENVNALTMITHVALPFVNVPIEEGAPEGLDYQAPTDVPEAESEVAELQSVIESEQESVIEDSETTDINLSTDVLFELEESELTSEADELIDGAAQEIEALNPTEVSVEGHADSSGTDEINDPLSEERAESVREALEERVDAAISYETEGFGSNEPIASNDDEDGRAQNRRVTISVPRGTEVAEEEDGGHQDSAPEPGAPAQGDGTPAEESAMSGPIKDGSDTEVDLALTSLEAIAPNTALLTYELHNPNYENVQVDMDMQSNMWSDFRYHATHAVTLNEPDGDRTAHPLRVHPPDGRDKPYCFCSSTSGIDMGSTIIPKDVTREYYAILPITPGTTVTDVTVGAIGTLEGVAIA